MIKHILIDGTTISRRMDGLSQYILNVVSRLPQRPDRQCHIVVRPDECPQTYVEVWRQRGIEVLTASIAPIGPLREWQFLRWLRTQRPFDAALVPSNQYPTALKIPTVYVVHDIIYERYSSQLGKNAFFKRWWLHANVACGLKQAQRVVAVSHFTKEELLRFHPKTNEGKISVVYEGWEHLRQEWSKEEVPMPFKEYILYIGSSRGHKNMNGLLKAMSIAADQMPEGAGLMIVGDDRMLSDAQRQMIDALQGRVMTTGWLSQEALNTYCNYAKAIIFPSLCEGFGIPVLEAFYFRKPLLLSNASSLPEVAGDAAIYFDPLQPEDIARQINSVWNMSDAEQALWIAKGQQRLKLFSWQKTADEIETIMSNILV